MVGASDQRLGAGSDAPLQRLLIAAAGYALLSILLAISAVMLARRLSGAFQQPLGGSAIILVAALFEAAVSGLRRLFQVTSLRSSLLNTPYLVLSSQHLSTLSKPPFEIRLSPIDMLSIMSLVAIVASLSIPGTPFWGLLLAWLLIVAGETIQRLPHFRWPRRQIAVHIPATPPFGPEEEPAEPEMPPGLVQQVTRVVEEGRESIHVLIKANIPASDRLAVVHIAFCPPLAEQPELTAHALDCDEAEIRITQSESFGARLEARLPSASAAPRSLVIELIGSATAGPDA
jgi:hypothetical protein